MNTLPTIYCSRCQETVKPIKGIVIYRCPECGAPFIGYAEATGGDESDEMQPDHARHELALA